MRNLKEKELIDIFKINPNGEIALLLGAGASVSSDIPSGQDMIWDFKKRIYCREHNISNARFKDILSDFNRRIIQNYFDEEGIAPQLNSSKEYSYYFERCYPLSNERTQYITQKVRDKKPSIGYLCLGECVKQQLISKVFTTNFDDLIEAGVHTLYPNLTLSKFSNSNINKYNFNPTIPTIVSLHGDFKYDRIQNTTEELVKLESKVITRCGQMLQTGRLVVIGYSGNDESIMSMLEQGLSNGLFPNGIIWCKKHKTLLNKRVMNFMEKACSLNQNSAIAEINGFDLLLHGVYRGMGYKNLSIEEQSTVNDNNTAAISFGTQEIQDEFLKTNAFMQLELPDKCLTFDTDIKTWAELKELNKDTKVIAGLHKGRVLSLSDESTLISVFGSHIKSKISKSQFLPPIFKDDTSVEMGLYYDIITYDLVKNKNMVRVSKRRFYNPNDISEKGDYYEAVEIRLVFVGTSICLTLIPTVELTDRTLNELDRQIAINNIMGNRRNSLNYELMRKWRDKFYNKEEACLKFEMKSCVIKFQALPLSSGGKKERNKEWEELKAFQFQEPELCFSESAKAKSYVNQLKGLISNSPLSESYSNMKQPDIQLAIFAPTKSSRVIYDHLAKLNQQFDVKSDSGFLQQYLGFEKIFKRKINIPQVGTKFFYSYDFVPKTNNYDEFYNFAKSYISSKIESQLFDVLIIYIPQEYSEFRECKTDEVYFDLHDAIKLFCADKSIRVQIIEDKSITNYDTCKVMWGLSVSLFTKARGELWKPKSYNPNSAFIGISYALMRDGRHYLGCSQMFDSAGNGMRLQLQELSDPKFIGKNPYMRSGDAFKIVSELRNTYSRSVSTEKLNRVVIHKTTPFTKEEICGINQALTGIDDVELIQIQEFTGWRAVLGKVDNIREGANYPLLRGTVIQLDENSFLLWTHGSVKNDELNGRYRNYFKGGRGIPTPLLIRRFQGNSSGDELAKEILMLSKMNLNSGDSLYKILPVTIDFAKTIARMIKQQDRQINALYDFRYFM